MQSLVCFIILTNLAQILQGLLFTICGILDDLWSLSMVLFCTIAVVTAWGLIPAGA